MTALTAARLGWAAVLIASPEAVLRVVGGEADPDRRWRVVGRVLGIRHLGQVWAAHRRPGRAEGVALVDSLHAASAFAFGLYSKRHRRLAIADSGIAASFALASFHCARADAPRVGRVASPRSTDA